MGRGKNKAKNMKVAREIKYSSENDDIESLADELSLDSFNENDHDDFSGGYNSFEAEDSELYNK